MRLNLFSFPITLKLIRHKIEKKFFCSPKVVMFLLAYKRQSIKRKSVLFADESISFYLSLYCHEVLPKLQCSISLVSSFLFLTYKSFSKEFKSLLNFLFLVKLVEIYNSREVVLTRCQCWNNSLKTSLYSSHEANFTIRFVVHRSLWKVKHRIWLSHIAQGNLKNEIFKFIISDFAFSMQKKTTLKIWNALLKLLILFWILKKRRTLFSFQYMFWP